MDVLVERYQRRKILTDETSPILFYLRRKPQTSGTVDIDTLAESIQTKCSMTKGDVKHVITALVEEIQAHLVNGDKVKLPELGTYHMTFSCPGVATSEECTVRNITRVNIRFTADKALKLVNGTTAETRSPANVNFVLVSAEEGTTSGGSTSGGTDNGGSGNQGGSSGGGGSDSGDGSDDNQGENPLG